MEYSYHENCCKTSHCMLPCQGWHHLLWGMVACWHGCCCFNPWTSLPSIQLEAPMQPSIAWTGKEESDRRLFKYIWRSHSQVRGCVFLISMYWWMPRPIIASDPKCQTKHYIGTDAEPYLDLTDVSIYLVRIQKLEGTCVVGIAVKLIWWNECYTVTSTSVRHRYTTMFVTMDLSKAAEHPRQYFPSHLEQYLVQHATTISKYGSGTSSMTRMCQRNYAEHRISRHSLAPTLGDRMVDRL